MPTPSTDPLRPLDTVVRIMAFFALTMTFAILPLAYLLGAHPVLGAWGDTDPCVLVPQSGLDLTGVPDTVQQIVNLRHGVAVGEPDQFRLCQSAMPSGTRALFSVPAALELIWAVGFLVLTLRLTSTARRHGLFTTPVARVTSALGAYLLVGWLVVATVHAVCFAAGIGHLIRGYSLGSGFIANFHWNWAVIIGGAATISIGRVMRQTIPMREELEATI